MLNNPPFMLSLPVLPSTRAQAEGSEGEGSKHENYFQQSASPQFSPGREARARRCPEIQGFVESSPRPELGTKAAERRVRDKARRRTVQYVEPFVRAERRRFGSAPHSLGEVG